MDPIQTTLTLLAGLWASMTLFLSTTKELNQLRDAILTGKHRGDVIDLEHRRLLLRSDWTPLFGVFVFVCMAFAFVAVLLASSSIHAAANPLVSWCGWAAALASLLSGLVWLHFGRIDIRMMRDRLTREAGATAAIGPSPSPQATAAVASTTAA